MNNSELADAYFRVMAPGSGCDQAYKTQRRRIAGLGIDISEHHQQNGSLEGLDIKYIGQSTKRILGLILEKGPEEARRVVADERREKELDEERSKAFFSVPRNPLGVSQTSKLLETGDDEPPNDLEGALELWEEP